MSVIILTNDDADLDEVLQETEFTATTPTEADLYDCFMLDYKIDDVK